MINNFDRRYRWLSNFQPCEVFLDGISYPSVEHAYQAAKTIDPEERLLFEGLTAGQAKRKGRRVTIREDWNDVKIQVMTDLCTQKFSKPPFRNRLKRTHDKTLIEGNKWGDRFWGVCHGNGKNHLGNIIMKIRDKHNMKSAI